MILLAVVVVAFWVFDALHTADRPISRDSLDETRTTKLEMLSD